MKSLKYPISYEFHLGSRFKTIVSIYRWVPKLLHKPSRILQIGRDTAMLLDTILAATNDFFTHALSKFLNSSSAVGI